VVNGLLLVALAIRLLGQGETVTAYRVTAEYLASFLFFWAYTTFKYGIWGTNLTTEPQEPTTDWKWRAWAESAGSFGALVLVAWAVGMLGQSWKTILGYGDAAAEAVPGVVVVVAALLVLSGGGRSRRRYRRR
jgi:Na+/melibiose symporter-like transporter